MGRIMAAIPPKAMARIIKAGMASKVTPAIMDRTITDRETRGKTITGKAIREMTMMMIIEKGVMIKTAHGKAIRTAGITDVKKEGKAIDPSHPYGGCLIAIPDA
jgi:hypothetical protein